MVNAISPEVSKCLDLTTQIVIASIQSGKLDASDGATVAQFFDVVYGQICECAGFTSSE